MTNIELSKSQRQPAPAACSCGLFEKMRDGGVLRITATKRPEAQKAERKIAIGKG